MHCGWCLEPVSGKLRGWADRRSPWLAARVRRSSASLVTSSTSAAAYEAGSGEKLLLDGEGELDKIMNDRYPSIRPTIMREYFEKKSHE